MQLRLRLHVEIFGCVPVTREEPVLGVLATHHVAHVDYTRGEPAAPWAAPPPGNDHDADVGVLVGMCLGVGVGARACAGVIVMCDVAADRVALDAVDVCTIDVLELRCCYVG